MTKRQLNAYRRAQKERPEKPKKFRGWSWESPLELAPGERRAVIKCEYRGGIPLYVNVAVKHRHIGVAKCRHCGRLRTVI